jgi:hypothetical protein
MLPNYNESDLIVFFFSIEALHLWWMSLRRCHESQALILPYLSIYLSTIISRLSTHLLQYASQLGAHFFYKKIGFILYCLSMSCRVICRKCMNFLRLEFNVNLLTFRWNALNNRCSSSYICSSSVWTSEQSNWSSMSRQCYVFEFGSTFIFNKCLNRLDFVAVCSPNCPRLSG